MQRGTSKIAKQSKMEAARRKWQPKPILGSEFTEDPPLQEVYVGVMKDKKHISIAIPSISAILPGFNHLKRCSSNRLLLAPLEASDQLTDLKSSEQNNILSQDKLKNILLEKGFDLSILEDDFQIVKVPRRAPKTKEQAARVSKIWPVNFHPDPNIESLISGLIFDDHLLDLIENYMKVVIEAAKLEAIGNLDCNGSAVVVDPEDGRIMAVSASRINEHPMWHAAMLAIDLVAKLQGGGAWKLGESNKPDEDEVRLTSPRDEGKNTEKNEKCIKRKYEEEAPLHYPESLKRIPLPAAEPLRSKNAQKPGRNNSSGKTKNCDDSDKMPDETSGEKTGPYLCTGYWVFLLEEPCPLCAMALLHSRISRIFYGVPNEKTGILGSKAILHSVPGLNHRYKVWGGIFEEECQEVWKEVKHKIAS